MNNNNIFLFILLIVLFTTTLFVCCKSGSDIQYVTQTVENETRINELRQQIESLNETHAQRVNDLNAQIDTLNAMIVALSNTGSDNESTINELRQQIESLNALLETLHDMYASTIDDLNAQIESLQNSLNNANHIAMYVIHVYETTQSFGATITTSNAMTKYITYTQNKSYVYANACYDYNVNILLSQAKSRFHNNAEFDIDANIIKDNVRNNKISYILFHDFVDINTTIFYVAFITRLY